MPEEEKDKKDDDNVILKVDMHCEACKEKVRKSLRGFPGLEKIDIDMKAQKVTVKGRVDAKKLYEQVKKRCGKRTQLLYPDLKKLEEKKKEEKKVEAETKKEEPPDIIVKLKVKMHCGGCAKEVRSSVMKMEGVKEVTVDADAEVVVVKGKNIDPKKVCERVMKKTRKHAEIVPQPPPPPKKEEKPEEKKEEKKEESKEEKTEEKPEEKKEEKAEEKKEEKPEENKEENKEEKKEGSAEESKEESKEEKKEEAKVEEQKEEKKEEEAQKEEKKEEGKEDGKEVEIKTEIKKSEYMPMRIISEYEYPPQLFSDENPNACSIM